MSIQISSQVGPVWENYVFFLNSEVLLGIFWAGFVATLSFDGDTNFNKMSCNFEKR